MEIGDYRTKLALTRSRYNEAAQELKDNYKDQVDRQKKIHEDRQKSQRENYINQRENMEELSEGRFRKYDKQLKKALKERTERYNKSLVEERRDHENRRKKIMGDYKQRLSSISKSFETANTEKDKIHNMYKDTMIERYEVGLADREKAFNERIGKLQQINAEKTNQFRDMTNREKQNMLTEHNNQKKELTQAANLSRNRANSLHQLDMERLLEGAKQTENTIRNNFLNSMHALKVTKNAENENQRKTFETLTDRIQEKNRQEFHRLSLANKADKRQLERRFAQDRSELERQTNSLLNEDIATKVKVKSSRKALEREHENQLANIKDAVDERTRNNKILNERIVQDNINALKDLESKNKSVIQRKDAEMRDIRQREIGGLKEQMENTNDLNTRRYRNLEKYSEGARVMARKNLNSRLGNQRREFSRSINQINQANQDVISEMRNEMAKEQSNFIEKTKEDTFNEMSDLKTEYEQKLEKTESSLKGQLADAKKETLNTANRYQNMIDALKKKSAKEMSVLKKFENQRRIEDRKAARRELNIQQREFQKSMNALRREYDRRLENTKAQSDIHIAKLTERYENMINQERAEFHTERQQIVSNNTANYNRLVDESKIEKDNLINQYEFKIEKLRLANLKANEIRQNRNRG